MVEEAFAACLEQKRALPRTGDQLADFGAGWDMHIGFGVANPVLYAVMYGRPGGRRLSRRAGRLGSVTGLFTAVEEALLRQWLRMLAEQPEPVRGDAGGASPAFREVAGRRERGDDQRRR